MFNRIFLISKNLLILIVVFIREVLFGSEDVETSENYHPLDLEPKVNPATGLPMLDEFIDVGGNPFGTSINQDTNNFS